MTEREQYVADRSRIYETAEQLGMKAMVELMDEALWNGSEQTRFLSGEVRELDEIFD